MSIVNSTPTNQISQQTPQQPKSRFPRLQECAHFHYEVSTVDLPKNFKAIMCIENDSNENLKPNVNNGSSTANNITPTTTHNITPSTSMTPSLMSSQNENIWFNVQVVSNEKRWIIYRTYENFRYLDKHLHDCIFDRKFSCLEELNPISSADLMSSSTMSTLSSTSKNKSNHRSTELTKQLRQNLSIYLNRLFEIAFVNPINCGPILNWFEIDNKGNRLFAIDDSPINIPGVAAAVVKKRYVAQGLDEISLDVGNMISVIDMPPLDESVWWRGKKELEVGFFPSDCVELIKCNQPFSNNVTDNLLKNNQSVRLKHGKLITLLRSFFNTRPARNQLQQKGILKQRVFACDLGEHLSNTQQEVPKILKICTEFIEKYGIVDGIYRHTGLQSNIQKLRNAFDEEKFAEINQEIYINDVHSVSSLLKMYFRELPNPLLTYQLYHKFIKAVNVEDKIIEIHDVVQQLPPPHYRTLAFLMRHLHKLAESSPETNMNTKNLAIVWAPNLLKSKEMDSKECMQYDMLHSITLQANISEFLIANADTIFNDKFASLVRSKDMKNNIAKSYRPISVCYNTGGAKLLSLEEAQDKYKQVGPSEIPKYHTVIEIPDLNKKKKNKDKDKKSNVNSISSNGSNLPTNAANSVPTNVHIQQQFEALQQHQQHTLTTSSSSHVLSSLGSSNVSQAIPIQTPSDSSKLSSASTNNGMSTSGSSSPAFKSLFRNLRVGSLKYQSSSSNTNSNNNNNTNLSSITNVVDNIINSNTQFITQLPSNHANTNLARTASTSTFKPLPSSTLGITSPSNDLKNDYNNCISQLQSAAAQAMMSSSQHHSSNSNNLGNHHNNNSNIISYTGSLSPPSSNANISVTSPHSSVLLRTNKLNQSQHSIHSNMLNSVHHNANSHCNQNNSNQLILSTFSPSSTFVSNLEMRKCENNSSPSSNTNANPIPSKRRTIQINNPSGQSLSSPSTKTLPTSNSSSNLNSFNSILNKANAPPPPQPLTSTTNNQANENKPKTNSNSNLEQQQYLLDNVPFLDNAPSMRKHENDKENQISSAIHHQQRKSSNSNNEDEMQKIVAYMNHFEKENIIIKNPDIIQNQNDAEYVVVNNIEKSLDQSEQASSPPQEATLLLVNQDAVNKALINSFGDDLPSIGDEPSKLRLSSSSLSSSAADSNISNLDNNNFDQIELENNEEINTKEHQNTTTIKIDSINELDTVCVATQNLNSILSSNSATNIYANPNKAPIDRRTYIVNKIYDHFDDERDNDNEIGGELKVKPNENEEEEENQYEKVILNANNLNKQVEISKEECEYDNGLNFASTIINQANNDEHIYVNVAELKKSITKEVGNKLVKPENETRESLGFDISHLKYPLNDNTEETNHYENTLQFDLTTHSDIPKTNENNEVKATLANNDEKPIAVDSSEMKKTESFENNFDSELVELNNQIKNLLKRSSNEVTAVVEMKVDSYIEPIVVNENTQKSAPKDAANEKEVALVEPVPACVSIPPVTLRSKSINSISKSTSIDEIKKSFRNENNDKQDQNSFARQNQKTRNSLRSKSSMTDQYESNEKNTPIKSNQQSDILNAKRKSSINFDELKRRKSDNNHENNEINSVESNKEKKVFQSSSAKKPNVMPKYRQSISISTASPTSHMEISTSPQSTREKFKEVSSSSNNNSNNNTNLFNINLKNMSKSMMDTSKSKSLDLEVHSIDSSDTSSLADGKNQGKASVKSKIKLMESFVNNLSTSHSKSAEHRSSSTSSSASTTSTSSSTSRSPPLSPLHQNANISFDKNNQEMQANNDSTKIPPTIIARSNTTQLPVTAPRPLAKPVTKKENAPTNSKSTSKPMSSNESIDKHLEETHLIYNSDNNIKSFNKNEIGASKIELPLNKQSLASLKEKRQTVKELMSKFEPK